MFMSDKTKLIIIRILYTAFYDSREDRVCRIFIPGEQKVFKKFLKILKYYIGQGEEKLWHSYGTEGEHVLNASWFCRYLEYQVSIQEVYSYAVEKQHRIEKEIFLEKLAEQARRYGAQWEVEVSDEEKALIIRFYQMVLDVVLSIIIDITPEMPSSKNESICLIRQKIAQGMAEEETGYLVGSGDGWRRETGALLYRSLKEEELEENEIWWCIRCCIDYDIRDCADLIVGIAKGSYQKAWIRQTAVEYVCRTMDAKEACEKMLPLYGRLFYWALDQYADSSDEQLKTLMMDYADSHSGQEMYRDICLVKMQDKEGLRGIRHYLERMRHVPKNIETPDPIEAIGRVKSGELLDELEKLLVLLMRDNFRDRSFDGLQTALVFAFSGVACSGERHKKKVFDLLNKYRQKENLQGTDRAAGEAAGETDKKKRIVKQLLEDVWWRCEENFGNQ